MCRLLGISKFWSGDLPSIGKVGVTYCILGVTHMCSCFNSLIVVSIPINFLFEMIVSLCWSWLGSPHTVHLGSVSGGSFGIFGTLSRLLYLHSTYMPCFHQSCWSLDHSLGFFCGFTQKPRLVSMALSARVKMESYCDGYVWFNFGQSKLVSLRVIWLWKRMPCLYVGYLGNFWLFFVSNRLQTCALDNVAGLRNGKDKELKVKLFQNFIAFGCPFVQWQLQNHYLTIVLLVKKLCLSIHSKSEAKMARSHYILEAPPLCGPILQKIPHWNIILLFSTRSFKAWLECVMIKVLCEGKLW